MSKQFALTFKVPLSDDMFECAEVLTKLKVITEEFAQMAAGQLAKTTYELTTDVISKRAGKKTEPALKDA